jgi:hypothetical protein
LILEWDAEIADEGDRVRASAPGRRSLQGEAQHYAYRAVQRTRSAIRLENSFGELDIDGWDRPEVEVDAKERAQIGAKQDGNDVVISTGYPPRNGFMRLLSGRGDIEISYRIKAPRASKLIIIAEGWPFPILVAIFMRRSRDRPQTSIRCANHFGYFLWIRMFPL